MVSGNDHQVAAKKALELPEKAGDDEELDAFSVDCP